MIEVKVDDAQVKAMLQRLAQRMGNLTPVMRAAGDVLRNDAAANFKGQHGPDGAPWHKLAQSTLLARAKRLSGKGGIYTQKGQLRKPAARLMANAKILLDRGTLRQSVQVLQTTPTSVTVGSRLPYAAIHQLGGKAGRGGKVRIPARPFIGMSANAERQIINTINAYLGTVQA